MKFDRIKIITNVENISGIDTNKFVENCKNGTTLYYKYSQNVPFHVCIIANYQTGELSVEFTGKILLDDYKHLISKDNIRTCFQKINQMGICNLDIDNIINDAIVVKCDVTQDVNTKCLSEIISYVKLNIKNYRKWIVKQYRDGIVIENTVKTPKHKKRLIIYQKGNELQKAANNSFLNALENRTSMLQYYNDVVRFELNINTMKQIRDLLGIDDNRLCKVLNATTNPILSVINQTIKFTDNQSAYDVMTLREYERKLLIESCSYDMNEIEMKLRSLMSKNTSITRLLKPYRELCTKLLEVNSSEIFDFRKLLEDDE